MKKIDGQIFKNMVISGSNNLYNSYPEVDALNVFPIPDGDTGTNMNLTMVTGVKAIQFNNSDDISYIAKLLADSTIYASYGNSGSILAFFFKGFNEALKGRKEIDVLELSEVLEEAAKSTYRGVIQPVEGTMLTVIREASEKLKEHISTKLSIEDAFKIYLEGARLSLERTPNLLPVLREVGVVDSGGAGFLKIVEGMESYLNGKMIERLSNQPLEEEKKPTAVQAQFEEEEFGYCTEFVLHLKPDGENKRLFNKTRFVNYLSSHGNSVVFIDNDDIIKVHIHTLKPGEILNYAQNFGEFKRIKCQNMSEQHHEIIVNEEEEGRSVDETSKMEAPLIVGKEEKKLHKKFALIATSSGEGVDTLFKECGVDEIVSGGQTNNPSAQDFIDASHKANADTVFILPNNSNILMSANQARDLLEKELDVVVIPTKTIMQGVVSAMNFNPELSKEDNVENLTEAIKTVKSGAVTYSIKDTVLNNVKIKKGEFMSIRETKDIIGCYKNKFDALFKLLEGIIDEDSAVCTILVGDDITAKDCKKINEKFEKKFPLVELDLREGKQPVYSFLVGVE